MPQALRRPLPGALAFLALVLLAPTLVHAQADAASRASNQPMAPFRIVGDSLTFPPVAADRILKDGDTVSLGGTVMTAHLTPGHTPGNTTWTTTAVENGKTYAVAFIGSVSINPGVVLLGNPKYPGIAGDYARSFQVMKALPCEVFLGPHGSFFDLQGKARRLAAGEVPNPFVDPAGCRAYLARYEAAYEEQLRREKRAALP